MTDPEAPALRRIVLDQTLREVGVPVLLFSSETLDVGAGDGPEPEVVTRTAAGLQLDLGALELFSSDAYLLQSALGETLPHPDQPGPLA